MDPLESNGLSVPTPGALIIRIYQVAQQHKVTTSGATYLHFFIRIIAESGLLYLSITLAHFLAWFGTSKFAIDVISVLVSITSFFFYSGIIFANKSYK